MIKDLGFLFDSKILFNAHVSAIKNKALAMIRRNCSNFHDPLAFKCLYTSLVRSLLVSLIWDHNHAGHNDQLEKVQNKVLRLICHKCNILRILWLLNLTLITLNT